MNIVADRAIPFLQEYFADLGSLEAVDGRDIDRDRVRNAELLLVRTVTGVGRRLLEGSSVRFVASPGAGVDHVDLAWLRTAGIGFAHAPGSNARAVAEYVLSRRLGNLAARLSGFPVRVWPRPFSVFCCCFMAQPASLPS